MITVQPFEYHKNLLGILLIETNAIVLDNNSVQAIPWFAINLNCWSRIFFSEFNSIAQQVLKKLPYQAGNTPYLWQVFKTYLCRRFLNFNLKICNYFLQYLA